MMDLVMILRLIMILIITSIVFMFTHPAIVEAAAVVVLGIMILGVFDHMERDSRDPGAPDGL